MNQPIQISDLDPFIDFEVEIQKLKKDLNAIILGHYYQIDDIQDIADFVGDSLELSRKAMQTDASVIVFCGVKFMAEVAHIVNPNCTVLLPDLSAGCSLENLCQPEDFKKFRSAHPDHIALTYINCSAEVKALSDIIVTSSNAEKIISHIPKNQKILFAPDKHLGRYLSKKTSRDMLLWNGTCIVHENFSERELIRLKTTHSNARIIAHPECPMHLLDYAEHIGSTSSLIKYATKHNGDEFIVLTEPGIIRQMQIHSPASKFYAVNSINQSGCVSCSDCPYMKKNTIEKLYLCMVNQFPKITLDYNIAQKAKLSIDRMMEYSSM
ncbi:MAG: quinolinate synthase NadA [Rickettsiaceae bacterium]